MKSISMHPAGAGKLMLPLFLSAGMLTGCVQIPQSPSNLAAKTQFNDDTVRVKRISESRLNDGTISIAVFAESASRFDKSVRYRVRWYDDRGAPINTSLDNWLEMNVVGEAPFEFTSVGPGPRAARYVVEFESR